MVKHLKDALRKEMRAKRDALHPAELRRFSDNIEERLFSRPRFREAGTVGFYLPKGSEVDTQGMIIRALRLGKKVVVPVTGREIEFYYFSSFDDLQEGRYGIMEPRGRNGPCVDPDLLVIPGVSFGLCMHRLGYGKGYYDRFLSASHAYRVGVCFDFQVVEKLPRHEDDERMDEIITEKRIITL
jgi:5-formyltetrahydrofolate cyclo-ligase